MAWLQGQGVWRGVHPSVCGAPSPAWCCVAVFLSRLCSAGISGSVGSCGGGLALTSSPPPFSGSATPIHLWPPPRPPPTHLPALPTLPWHPKVFGSQIGWGGGEPQEASLPAPPSRRAPLPSQSPPPPPTHTQFKNTKPGLVALSAASLSAQPAARPSAGPLPFLLSTHKASSSGLPGL